MYNNYYLYKIRLTSTEYNIKKWYQKNKDEIASILNGMVYVITGGSDFFCEQFLKVRCLYEIFSLAVSIHCSISGRPLKKSRYCIRAEKEVIPARELSTVCET